MCIFCKIVNKELPSSIEHKNEDFLAFHDINPKAPIHLLIIPKQHFENFQTTPPEIMAGLTAFVQELTQKLGLDESGYRLVTNNGEGGGQEVFHLHFHLLGGAKLAWDHTTDNPQRNI
jgi:histidine triad (HIT) family protein